MQSSLVVTTKIALFKAVIFWEFKQEYRVPFVKDWLKYSKSLLPVCNIVGSTLQYKVSWGEGCYDLALYK